VVETVANECEFCRSSGGEIVWENALCRVVRVDDPNYPGFCRVILQPHRREMTDLSSSDRMQLMTVVFAVECALRRLYQPDKINLASLGNLTPHVHWHVIPRWRDDPHFPNSIWTAEQRIDSPKRLPVNSRQLGDQIICAIRKTLS